MRDVKKRYTLRKVKKQWMVGVSTLFGGALLLSAQGTIVHADEFDGVWEARTPEQIRADILNLKPGERYQIRWGDTLANIDKALDGIPDNDLNNLASINGIDLTAGGELALGTQFDFYISSKERELALQNQDRNLNGQQRMELATGQTVDSVAGAATSTGQTKSASGQKAVATSVIEASATKASLDAVKSKDSVKSSIQSTSKKALDSVVSGMEHLTDSGVYRVEEVERVTAAKPEIQKAIVQQVSEVVSEIAEEKGVKSKSAKKALKEVAAEVAAQVATDVTEEVVAGVPLKEALKEEAASLDRAAELIAETHVPLSVVPEVMSVLAEKVAEDPNTPKSELKELIKEEVAVATFEEHKEAGDSTAESAAAAFPEVNKKTQTAIVDSVEKLPEERQPELISLVGELEKPTVSEVKAAQEQVETLVTPSSEEVQQLAQELGVPENEVKEIVQSASEDLVEQAQEASEEAKTLTASFTETIATNAALEAAKAPEATPETIIEVATDSIVSILASNPELEGKETEALKAAVPEIEKIVLEEAQSLIQSSEVQGANPNEVIAEVIGTLVPNVIVEVLDGEKAETVLKNQQADVKEIAEKTDLSGVSPENLGKVLHEVVDVTLSETDKEKGEHVSATQLQETVVETNAKVTFETAVGEGQDAAAALASVLPADLKPEVASLAVQAVEQAPETVQSELVAELAGKGSKLTEKDVKQEAKELTEIAEDLGSASELEATLGVQLPAELVKQLNDDVVEERTETIERSHEEELLESVADSTIEIAAEKKAEEAEGKKGSSTETVVSAAVEASIETMASLPEVFDEESVKRVEKEKEGITEKLVPVVEKALESADLSKKDKKEVVAEVAAPLVAAITQDVAAGESTKDAVKEEGDHAKKDLKAVDFSSIESEAIPAAVSAVVESSTEGVGQSSDNPQEVAVEAATVATFEAKLEGGGSEEEAVKAAFPKAGAEVQEAIVTALENSSDEKDEQLVKELVERSEDGRLTTGEVQSAATTIEGLNDNQQEIAEVLGEVQLPKGLDVKEIQEAVSEDVIETNEKKADETQKIEEALVREESISAAEEVLTGPEATGGQVDLSNQETLIQVTMAASLQQAAETIHEIPEADGGATDQRLTKAMTSLAEVLPEVEEEVAEVVDKLKESGENVTPEVIQQTAAQVAGSVIADLVEGTLDGETPQEALEEQKERVDDFVALNFSELFGDEDAPEVIGDVLGTSLSSEEALSEKQLQEVAKEVEAGDDFADAIEEGKSEQEALKESLGEVNEDELKAAEQAVADVAGEADSQELAGKLAEAAADGQLTKQEIESAQAEVVAEDTHGAETREIAELAGIDLPEEAVIKPEVDVTPSAVSETKEEAKQTDDEQAQEIVSKLTADTAWNDDSITKDINVNAGDGFTLETYVDGNFVRISHNGKSITGFNRNGKGNFNFTEGTPNEQLSALELKVKEDLLNQF